MHEVTTVHAYALSEVTPMGSTESKELSGGYNTAQILDDIVRLHVKALGFEVNRNGFQFKRGPLERVHMNAFGEPMASYKSFESKVVNRNHWMSDQSRHGDHPIGYIEKAYLKDDGVYLDLVLWKRTLSESELSQLRNGTAHVSMEVEYTNPIKTGSGVRTMSANSTVSFVGIAVLFDGIQPGDQTSGILAVENAALQEEGVAATERTTYTTEEIASTKPIPTQGDHVENLTPEQIAQLQSELASAKERAEQLEAEKAEVLAAKEAAEVTAQELEAKCKERDEKLTELYAKESEYQALQQQLSAMREAAFNDNLGKCFDADKLEDGEKAFMRSLFSGCYGEAEPAPYLELACKLVCIAGAATEMVISACQKEEAGEGETSASEDATATADSASATTSGELAANEPPQPPDPAPSIAGTKPVEDKFTLKHLR